MKIKKSRNQRRKSLKALRKNLRRNFPRVIKMKLLIYPRKTTILEKMREKSKIFEKKRRHPPKMKKSLQQINYLKR